MYWLKLKYYLLTKIKIPYISILHGFVILLVKAHKKTSWKVPIGFIYPWKNLFIIFYYNFNQKYKEILSYQLVKVLVKAIFMKSPKMDISLIFQLVKVVLVKVIGL